MPVIQEENRTELCIAVVKYEIIDVMSDLVIPKSNKEIKANTRLVI